MGVEWACVPSRATHLMFLPVLGSNESGRPFSAETMLRDQAWPHCGWSVEAHGKVQLATSAHHTGRAGDNVNFIVTTDTYNASQGGASLHVSWEGLVIVSAWFAAPASWIVVGEGTHRIG